MILFHQYGDFLSILLMVVSDSIIWGFFKSFHIFVRGVYVGLWVKMGQGYLKCLNTLKFCSFGTFELSAMLIMKLVQSWSSFVTLES